nr:hypothetical protein [Streptomyces chartreusis]
MQNPSDSMEIPESGENGRSDTADSPVVDDPTPDSDIVSGTASTVLVEVLPGVAVVCGAEVPAELKPDLLDFGIVSAADRKQISTVLAAIGNTATVAGNLGNALASVQGLYRLSAATQAWLNAGATLAVKNGANLGAVFANGKIVHQARLLPVASVSAAQNAASIGPALAMVGLQMQLNEVTDLVRTNIALTSQVLTAIRNEQWTELTGLVATIDRAIDQAREIESVPASLWDNVAGSEASLRKQVDLYRLNVRGHVGQIDRADASRRREYLQMNAEAIVFDANALLSSLKAWTGYQALRAGRARAAGREDADEARLVDVIARDTRAELDSALTEATSLADSLTRELRIIAELPDATHCRCRGSGRSRSQPAKPPPVFWRRSSLLPMLSIRRPLRWRLRASSAHPHRWISNRTFASCDGSSLTVRPCASSASPISSMLSVPFPRSSVERRRS